MIEYTVSRLMEEAVRSHEDAAALFFPDENVRVSYRQLKENADLVSKALLHNGFRKGEHIGIWSTNCSKWVYLALGAAQIGVVFIPLNVSYKGRELMAICKRADIHALFTMDSFRGISCAETIGCFFKDHILDSAQFPELRAIYDIGSDDCKPFLTWGDFVCGAGSITDDELNAAKSEVKNSDVYIIQYTSGTTAKPKGARLCQKGVLNTAQCYAQLLHMESSDITCVPLPLFHCYGNVLTLLGGILSGSCTVYMETFSAKKMLPLLAQEKCTAVMGVPTMYSALMQQPDFDKSLLSIKKAGTGGSYCPPALAKQIEERFGMEHLIIGYGLSEAASLCTLSDINGPESCRLYTVGKPLPGLEVSLYDRKSGCVSIKAERGEIVVRGFGVMLDYYKDAENTAEALDDDGWLHTGDLGTFDENGYLKISGRIKDIIIRGGENISPSEIEEVIVELDEVQDCQCAGVCDKVMGEEIAAFIIPRAGMSVDPERVREHVASHLAKYKIPKYIFIVDAFPVNASGKVLRRKLSEQALQLIEQHKNI